MQIVTLDFETYWSATFSLSRLSAIEYARSPEFEVISCGVKVGDAPTRVYFGADVADALAAIDWKDACALAHNMAGFDAYVLSLHYNVNPRLWADTLAMARPWHARGCGVSLAALVERYGLGVKDSRVLNETRGRRLAQFSRAERDDMARYNAADVEQCRALFNILRARTSDEEMALIDMTVRMATQPAFQADLPRLREALKAEKKQKRAALLSLGKTLAPEEDTDDPLGVYEAVRAKLASAPKFAQFLASRGVAPPMKISPATGKETFAFARTDEAFAALQEHDDPEVALAASARLNVKSTLLETRLEKVIRIAEACGGALPIPLRYCGADTTGRWSGEEINAQNLPRVTPGAPRISDALRMSLVAPTGKVIIVSDLSGIELRVNHFLWRTPGSMAAFQADPEKADLYRQFAARLFGKPEAEVTKTERQVGKVAHLGLGYGAGWAAFKSFARTMAGLEFSEEASRNIVDAWRGAYPEIVAGWRAAAKCLPAMLDDAPIGAGVPIDPGGLCHAAPGGVRLPSGRQVLYPGLRLGTSDDGAPEWLFTNRRAASRLYGARVVENIVQAVARDIIARQALLYRRETGLRPALMVHDELVYVVPEADAKTRLAQLLAVMRRAPDWWPELPLWAEGGIAKRYGEAK
jgi:DNA polymerase